MALRLRVREEQRPNHMEFQTSPETECVYCGYVNQETSGTALRIYHRGSTDTENEILTPEETREEW